MGYNLRKIESKRPRQNFSGKNLSRQAGYNFQEIEKKWQMRWEKEGLYRAEDFSERPKKYILLEFPYPSGEGLHVGHCRSYSALDTFARKKRMEGYNVLFPMGWDAFGLPTENFAIKNKIHPQRATKQNIANFKKQIKSLGLSFDWSREINTTDPKYYKWTQWIFLKLFEHGLAYQAEMPINWCPSCKIGLANEEVVNGKCERCGAATEKKVRKQWMLKITAYADRLIEGLEKVDYPERVKAQQVNWIGKSKGATVKFQITNYNPQKNTKFKISPFVPNGTSADKQNSKFFLEVFTTRPDTLFGCTYLVVAPEHDLVASLLKSQIPNSNNQSNPKFQIPKEIKIQNIEEIKDYLEKAKRKSDLERTELIKEKTGVELKGIKAINPVNNQEIPIWIADYVLPYYGTGAIMAVPAHDERDFEFAKKFKIDIQRVIIPNDDLKSFFMEDSFNGDVEKELKENNFNYTINDKGGFYVLLKLSDLDNYIEIVKKHLKKEFWCEIVGTKTIFIYGDGEIIEVINKQDSIKALKKCKEFYEPMNAHYNLWEMLWNCEFYHDILCFTGDGININSDFLDGLETKKAKEKIIRWLEEKGVGKKAVNYKLRDWVFSRQHYWGEPIPLIFCPACKKRVENYKSKIANPKQIQNSKFKIQNFEFNLGEILNPGWIAVPEEELPVELPCLEKYQPTGTGESPLANVKEWVNCKCPKCGGVARRETDTMPNWAGSSWYFMRYIDPENDKFLADKKKLKYWMPIDWYNGGMEHTTLHLLYSRFWYKFLFDIGIVSQDEPYQKRTSHGIVLAEDGRKMSKSFGNVINPDDIIREYGADSLRLYEMFMGPFEQTISWNMQGVVGMRRFLEKVWTLRSKVNSEAVVGSEAEQSRSNTLNNLNNGNRLKRLVCQTIKKVTEDIDNFKFNTAISALMILANEFEKENQISSIRYQVFLKLLSPFAPHICEEIYQSLKLRVPITDGQSYLKSQIPNHHKEFKSIFQERWPKYNPKLVKEEKNTLIIQINGKLRDKIEVEANISEEEVKELVLSREKVVRWTKGKEIRKIVFVSGKLINIVC